MDVRVFETGRWVKTHLIGQRKIESTKYCDKPQIVLDFAIPSLDLKVSKWIPVLNEGEKGITGFHSPIGSFIQAVSGVHVEPNDEFDLNKYNNIDVLGFFQMPRKMQNQTSEPKETLTLFAPLPKEYADKEATTKKQDEPKKEEKIKDATPTDGAVIVWSVSKSSVDEFIAGEDREVYLQQNETVKKLLDGKDIPYRATKKYYVFKTSGPKFSKLATESGLKVKQIPFTE